MYKRQWPEMSDRMRRKAMYEVINDIDKQYTKKELREITMRLHETQADVDARMEVMIANQREMEQLRWTPEKQALFKLCNDLENGLTALASIVPCINPPRKY